MAAFLSARNATIILAVIAFVYSIISVVLLAFICCLCYRKRKRKPCAVTPKDVNQISPLASEAERDASPNSSSPTGKGPIDISSVAAEKNELPNRYRSKGRKKAKQVIETCPEWEGVRDSPVLRQREAWSIEKDLDVLSRHTKTPDSGLAVSLGGSKSADSSSKGSQSSGSNEDVFDENVASDLSSKSFEEKKREVHRRPPKPVRTESTTPLMDEDDDTCYSPNSDMEFTTKTALPPIREKPRSSDSLEGTVFTNKSAIDGADREKTTYTELSTISTHLVVGGKVVLPPIKGHGLGGPRLAERDRDLLSKVGQLPPLHPPGHSQENLHELEEESTNL